MTASANRHDGTLDGKFTLPQESATVTIRTSPKFAETVGGQHLLWMLINLVARQYDVVGRIRLAVPGVVLHDIVAPLCASGDLASTLLALGGALSKQKLIIEPTEDFGTRDLVELSIAGVDHGEWEGYGDGWRVAVGRAQSLSPNIPASEVPIGPYFAACLLAGEVFKSVRKLSEDRRRFDALHLSLWAFGTAEAFTKLDDGPNPDVHIPLVYLVGAGAVSQAFAATIRACQSVSARLIVTDHDAIDDELTNLNRYCLALPTDAGANKALLIARFFPQERFKIHPVPTSWEEYLQQDTHPWPEVRSAERNGRFELTVSAVDINPARHAIQNMWPRLIYGGSTLDLATTIQRYDLTRDDECLRCSNLIQEWTVERQTTELQQLSMEKRRELALSVGANIELVEAHVANPKCGSVAEAEMQKFGSAASTPTQWSVGFVSVGAGVLLAARLLHDLLAPSSAEAAHRFSFERNASRKTFHRPRPECLCIARGREIHQRMWGS